MSAGKNRSSVEETPCDVNRRLASPSAELLPSNNCFIPNMRLRGFRAALLGVDPNRRDGCSAESLVILAVRILMTPVPIESQERAHRGKFCCSETVGYTDFSNG
jgi:hypothetical protein